MSDRRPSPPLALTDEQLRIVREHPAHLLPAARSAFLQRVAQLLRGERELAEGVVSRACRAAQAEFIARSAPLAIDGCS
jgi:hypothetical protein